MGSAHSRLHFFKPYHVTKEAFDREWVDGLRDSILQSPLLCQTTLNSRFAGTLGFSIAFRRSGLGKIEKNFPHFKTYLEAVMHPKGNAFFLNPLVVNKGGRVAPHVDRSLRGWTAPETPPYPLKVSVLYVSVPQPFLGGELILYRRRPLLKLQPQTNLLFQFQGKLRHEITEVTQAGADPEHPQPRVSLVCEHYRLPDSLLKRVPDFFLRSKRPFEDFLSQALEESED